MKPIKSTPKPAAPAKPASRPVPGKPAGGSTGKPGAKG